MNERITNERTNEQIEQTKKNIKINGKKIIKINGKKIMKENQSTREKNRRLQGREQHIKQCQSIGMCYLQESNPRPLVFTVMKGERCSLVLRQFLTYLKKCTFLNVNRVLYRSFIHFK